MIAIYAQQVYVVIKILRANVFRAKIDIQNFKYYRESFIFIR